MDSFSSHGKPSGIQFHLLPTRGGNCEEKQLWLRSASGTGLPLDGVLQSSQPSLMVGLLPTSPGHYTLDRAETSALVVMATCDFSGVLTLSLSSAEADAASQPKNK